MTDVLTDLRDDISAAKTSLDIARRMGDPLRVDLAESNLNDLLDRYQLQLLHVKESEK